MKTFESVANLKLSHLQAGQLVAVKGVGEYEVVLPGAGGVALANGNEAVPDTVVTVKHFGAVGDGVTDDTAAIQAAIDYVSSGGVFIHTPPGVYLVSQLDFSNVIDVTFGGEAVVGWTNVYHGAVFKAAGAITNVIHFDPGVRINARNYFQNILIDCDSVATNGVGIDNFSVFGFRNVVVVNALGDSFLLGGSNASFGADFVECYSNGAAGSAYNISAKLCRLNSCTADSGQYSVRLQPTSGQCSVRDCNFEGASIETAYVESDNNKFSDNNFQAPSEASTVYRLAGQFNTVTGGRATRNSGAGSKAFVIDGAANTIGNVTITGVETGVELRNANISLDGLIIDATTTAIIEIAPGGSNSITGGSIVSGSVSLANDETTITGTNGIQDRSAALYTTLPVGNTDNYDSGANAESVWIDTAAGASVLTGIAGGFSGRRLRVFNRGANTLTIANLNAASVITNRIITNTGADIVIPAFGGGVSLEYETSQGRWYVVA